MKITRLLVLLSLITFQCYSQERNFVDKPYLETVAMVDTLVIPDRIYMSIVISEKDTKGKKSVEDLERLMKTKLASLGIDLNRQLTISDLTSNFKNYFLKSTEVMKDKEYVLLVYDAKEAGKVIVGLESIQISNIKLIKTEYSKMDQIELALKQLAVQKAKVQAENLLLPLNQKVGQAIFISDMNAEFMSMLQTRDLVSNSGRFYVGLNYETSPASTEIEFDKIKIQSSITVKFMID